MYNGASLRAVITDIDDEKYIAVGQQVTSNSYGSLSLPYSYVGIGRSNNYIETLTVGFIVDGELNQRNWSPIIPNSQLVIYTQGSVAEDWGIELMTNPVEDMGLIISIDILFLAILGLVIIILHFQEKAEDSKQQLVAFDYL